MKKCKILAFPNPSPAADKENIINSYLAQGYEIKAVVCTPDNWEHVYLEITTR